MREIVSVSSKPQGRILVIGSYECPKICWCSPIITLQQQEMHVNAQLHILQSMQGIHLHVVKPLYRPNNEHRTINPPIFMTKYITLIIARLPICFLNWVGHVNRWLVLLLQYHLDGIQYAVKTARAYTNEHCQRKPKKIPFLLIKATFDRTKGWWIFFVLYRNRICFSQSWFRIIPRFTKLRYLQQCDNYP